MLRKKICFILVIVLLIFLFSKQNSIQVFDNNIDYKYNSQNYWGILIIPKINIKLKFYKYDSPLNDVSKNIEMINTSINDTYLIAAHSGIGQKAYFNDLYLLEEGDDIYLQFKDEKKHYIINKIYKIPKTGEISISKEKHKIYLTTCDQLIKGYQLVVEGSLIN